MENTFPQIRTAGLFESQKNLPNKKRSLDRIVQIYEIELFASDGCCSTYTVKSMK